MPGPGGKGRMGAAAKPKHTRATLLRLLSYLKPYRLLMTIVGASLLISAGAAVAGTYMLKPIINQIGELAVSKTGRLTDLLSQILLLAAIYCAGALCNYLLNRLVIIISTGTLERIRNDMFSRMEKLPLRYFDSRPHGEIMSLYTNDIDAMRDMISQGLPQLLSCSITVLGVLTMMIVLSPVLTLLVLAMFVLMLFIVKTLGAKSAFYFKKRQAALADVNGYTEEMIEGQREVKAFCREKVVSGEFDERSESLRTSSTSAMTFAMILMPIMGNLSYILYAAAAAAGAALAIAGRTDIGTLAAFLQYTRSFSQPLTQISQLFNGFISALAGAERIFALIDEAPEVDEGSVTLVNARILPDGSIEETAARTDVWAWKMPAPQGGFTYTQLKGDVRFHDVTFSYDGRKTVLSDVGLYAEPGQKIAFVGSTGAGKTTITNLINRFYDVQEGSITYDGIDVKAIRKDDLRRSLAMVLQDTHLFTGTVRENIRYGNLAATDEDVLGAARLANADYFIRHLPQGYDTVLTADGANLSQGQRQLLAIARAAVADPPVLILDEATSSIDTRTELLIEKGMDRLMRGRTVFVIAHRLSTVRNADAILVLEQGRVIERGDHDDLLAQRGKYYQLYMGTFELS